VLVAVLIKEEKKRRGAQAGGKSNQTKEQPLKMPRVRARRAAPTAATAATAATARAAPEQATEEEVEWVEWVDEPRHELLFEVPEEPAAAAAATKPIARAYAAVFPQGGERWTLFHRHRLDTAYVCISGAAGDATDTEAGVWNQVLKELEDPPSSPSGGPTHELLAPIRVEHATGQCFCNPHGTRDRGRYIHRIRYAATNPSTMHFVGVEVRPDDDREGGGAAAAASASPPPPAPHLALQPEGEQPALFRAWRLKVDADSSSKKSGPLGGGFARRGGAVVLIKEVDWSMVETEEGGPFGAAARARARAAGGWSAAAAAGSSSVFPAGASWPLTPGDGGAEFSLALTKDGGAVLEAMLVEFL
jgi:hypothetical protein